jgi:hypothetical protein
LGLDSGPTPWPAPPACFFFLWWVIFREVFMNYLHGLALKCVLPVLSPGYVCLQLWDTGISSVLGCFEIGSSHLPGLASNHGLPDICFLSSSHYRFDPPAAGLFTLFISLFGDKVKCYEQAFRRNSSVFTVLFTVSWVQLS